MAYLNTTSVLDKAQTAYAENHAALRTKMLVWLNEVVRDIHNEPRSWKFLEDTITLTITAGQATLPSGASEIVYLKGTDSDGNTWFLTMKDCLTDAEANELGTDSDSDLPDGFTLAPDGTITFYQYATGTCELKYEADFVIDLEDSASNTIYPKALENLFISGVRMKYYGYRKDGRFSSEAAIYAYQLSKVKAWDNRNKAASKQSAHGYTRVTA